MNSLSESQIKKMLEDIATIKEVLAKSRSSLQFLFHPFHFRLQSLVFSISIFVIAGTYHVLIRAYGSYGAIPEFYRYTMFIVIFVDWLILAFLKFSNWTDSLSKIDPRYSFRQALMELMTFRTIHSYLLFLITLTFFIIYWIVIGLPYLIIPTLSIGLGIFFNIIGNMTELRQYIISGSWMLIWGFIIIAAGSIPGTLAIIVSFGIGTAIFAVLGRFSRLPRMEEE